MTPMSGAHYFGDKPARFGLVETGASDIVAMRGDSDEAITIHGNADHFDSEGGGYWHVGERALLEARNLRHD